jgi:tetratricopeptide (TPR) repeat protein
MTVNIAGFNQLLASGAYNEAEAFLSEQTKEAQQQVVICRRLAGNLAVARGDHAAAEQIFRKLAADYPDDPLILNNLGHIRLLQKNYYAALDAFHHCLAITSELCSAYSGGAQCLIALNRSEEAQSLLKQSSFLAQSEISSLLGCTYNHTGNFAEAERWLLQSLQQKASAECLLELCVCLAAQEKYETALGIINKPEYRSLININLELNKVAILHLSGNVKQAEQYAETLREAHPLSADLLVNLATIKEDLGQPAHMLDLLKQAVTLQNDHGRARSLLFELYAKAGDFQNAWGFNNLRNDPRFCQPQIRELEALCRAIPTWNGSEYDLDLLILPEEGIGDQLMYASYLSQVQPPAQRCSLVIDHRLIPLIKSSLQHNYELLDSSQLINHTVARFTARAYIADVFAANINSTLALCSDRAVAWITSEQQTKDRCLQELQSQKRCRYTVGVSWASINPLIGKDKSLPLDQLLAIFDGLDVDLVNLQYDAQATVYDLAEALGHPFLHVSDINLKDDIVSMAALTDCCDAVVTISCFTAHLAGSLGKDTLLLTSNQRGRPWYWSHQDSRSHSSIYPSVRVIEKSRRLDTWDSVLAETQQLLAEKFSNRSQ